MLTLSSGVKLRSCSVCRRLPVSAAQSTHEGLDETAKCYAHRAHTVAARVNSLNRMATTPSRSSAVDEPVTAMTRSFYLLGRVSPTPILTKSVGRQACRPPQPAVTPARGAVGQFAANGQILGISTRAVTATTRASGKPHRRKSTGRYPPGPITIRLVW